MKTENNIIILIIDDDASDRLYLKKTIQRSGLLTQVEEAEDAKHAIQLLHQQGFDCIFLDLNLPDIPGEQLLPKMIQLKEEASIIVITGEDDKEKGSDLIKLGATDYLVKGDIIPQVLSKAVRYALARQKFQNQTLAQKQKIAKVTYDANHDMLTHLPNRFHFIETLQLEIKRAQRYGGMFSIIFLDLDDFKKINDEFGHEVGDQVLQEVAIRLKKSIRKSDMVARFGGDEFVFLLTGVQNSRSISTICHHILNNMKEPFQLKGVTLNVGPSIGIAIYPESGLKAEDLIKASDSAMYVSKIKGKNCFTYFEKALNYVEHIKARTSEEIQKGLASKDLSFYLQPQFDLKTMKTVGAEMLIRWNHPLAGMIKSKLLLSLLEETDNLDAIKEFSIQQAFEFIKHYHEVCSNKLLFSLNILPKQFYQKAFIDTLLYYCKKNQNAEQLVLELETSCFIEDAKHSIDTLMNIKKHGVSICLENFSMDAVCLRHFKNIPIDMIKIDKFFFEKSLLHSTHGTEHFFQMLHAMNAFAIQNNILIIAKDIDTQSYLDSVINIDCPVGQGPLLAKPMTFQNLLDLTSKISNVSTL